STRITSVPAPSDYYSFTVPTDQRVTLALKFLGASGLTLELQDGSGTTLATGVSADNLDQVIDRQLLTAGTYYPRITAPRIPGQASGDYSLVVTRAATFDTKPNDSFATAQDITGTVGSLGSFLNTTRVLNAADSGWWDSTGFHNATNKNYIAGQSAGTQ